MCIRRLGLLATAVTAGADRHAGCVGRTYLHRRLHVLKVSKKDWLT
jgi:hypothetical protein